VTNGINKKVLRTLVVLGVAGIVAGLGVFAAFTATTSNAGNNVTSGSVAIGDNDGGSTPLYLATNQKPGDTQVKCIKVTYTGSLPSSVKLYASSGITNGTAFNLKVERGTQSTGAFPACGDFAATSTAYDGAIGSFGTTYAGGVDGKASAAAWATNDEVAYRFTVTTNDDATANAHTSTQSTGAHTFTWEARNN
jgi:hypothetical protein